jgi:hypothetical protein
MAPEEAERVSRAEPPAATLAGLKEATTPAGRPEAPNTTVWAEPAVTAVAIVTAPDEPRTRAREAGLTPREKLATTGTETTRERGVVWVADGPVPVTTTA